MNPVINFTEDIICNFFYIHSIMKDNVRMANINQESFELKVYPVV